MLVVAAALFELVVLEIADGLLHSALRFVDLVVGDVVAPSHRRTSCRCTKSAVRDPKLANGPGSGSTVGRPDGGLTR